VKKSRAYRVGERLAAVRAAFQKHEAPRFFKNASSNVINAVSSAVFALAVPYFFVRALTPAEFSLWILVLQIGAYVGYLNFGLQAAIGRYVAYAIERNDQNHAEEILAAGLQILIVLGAVGFSVIAGMAVAFPYLFAQVPHGLVATARTCLLLVGAALSLGLPFLGVLGVFIGLQRNEIPALISIASKIIMAFALAISVYVTRDLVAVCWLYLALNLVTYFAQYAVYRIVCRGWRTSLFQVSPEARKELVSYCMSLTVWSLMTLIVNGLQTTIVGIFDFSAVGAYGAALSLVTFFAGITYTILSPLVQIFAKLHARGDDRRLIALLNATSFICTTGLIVIGAWMAVLAVPFFAAWLHGPIAIAALPFFGVLLAANIIRGIAYPYVNYLIGTARQRYVVITPVLEGVTNIVVGVTLCVHYGAIGVAVGTVAGGLVGIVANFIYNMPRTLPGGATVLDVFQSTIVQPFIYCAPIIFLLAGKMLYPIAFNTQIFLCVAATAAPVYGLWRHRNELMSGRFKSAP
jgi:O-antigen/teichoic acid export membrane protein